jgi:hypothetical protein
MTERTTLAAEKDDLDTLRAEARRRGVSLARLLREIVSERAKHLRERRRPRIGVARGGRGVARASSTHEDRPAKTRYRS